MGQIIVEELKKQSATAALVLSGFAPRPVVKKTRAERNAEIVEKRATHAVKMLKKAERRLKIAKNVRAVWAAKVGYYERVAAKRGSK